MQGRVVAAARAAPSWQGRCTVYRRLVLHHAAGLGQRGRSGRRRRQRQRVAWATMSRNCPPVTSVRIASSHRQSPGPAPRAPSPRAAAARRPHQQQVAEQDGPRAAEGRRVAQPAGVDVQRLELPVRRRPAAAQVGGVHHVVVHQRADVQQVEAGRRGAAAAPGAAASGIPAAADVAPDAERRAQPLAAVEQLGWPSRCSGASSGPIAASTAAARVEEGGDRGADGVPEAGAERGVGVQHRRRARSLGRGTADRGGTGDHMLSLRRRLRGPHLGCSHAGPDRVTAASADPDHRRAARDRRSGPCSPSSSSRPRTRPAAAAVADGPRARGPRRRLRLGHLRRQRLDPRAHHPAPPRQIAQHTTLRTVAHLTCASQSREQLRRVDRLVRRPPASGTCWPSAATCPAGRASPG